LKVETQKLTTRRGDGQHLYRRVSVPFGLVFLFLLFSTF
jgi:hypothetical protein